MKFLHSTRKAIIVSLFVNLLFFFIIPSALAFDQTGNGGKGVVADVAALMETKTATTENLKKLFDKYYVIGSTPTALYSGFYPFDFPNRSLIMDRENGQLVKATIAIQSQHIGNCIPLIPCVTYDVNITLLYKDNALAGGQLYVSSSHVMQ